MTNWFRRYYSAIGPGFGFFNVSIDSSTPQRLTAKSNSSLSQQLIWSNTSLGLGTHNITLTHDDIGFNVTGLDFFRLVINKVRVREKTSDFLYCRSVSFPGKAARLRSPRQAAALYSPRPSQPRALESQQRMCNQSVLPIKTKRTESR